jgi:hypothetical protein
LQQTASKEDNNDAVYGASLAFRKVRPVSLACCAKKKVFQLTLDTIFRPGFSRIGSTCLERPRRCSGADAWLCRDCANAEPLRSKLTHSIAIKDARWAMGR